VVITWRRLWIETTALLGDPVHARWLVEEVSGLEDEEWATDLDARATALAMARLDGLVARRLAGEPLQYVLGHWAFRHLDLLVDRRVLIPRPETELVAEVAIEHAKERLGAHRPLTIVDLGTGSGAVALSVVSELPPDAVEMWAVDSARDALDVARANLAGLSSRHGRNVRMVEGSWFTALPATLRERVDVVVANPPYVADHEELPSEVEAWEPATALRAGPTGLECYEQIVPDAARWLAPGGILVCELGARQGPPVAALARTAGFDAIEVLPDLAGRDRVLVARRPQPVT
jgi:release factor glutamine methyltransferase